ncbi:hypothetical protein ES708_23218 [subsurface metagenome]
MNCQRIKKLINPYIDQALEQKATQQVEEHLKSCSACREEHLKLKQIVSALNFVSTLPAPAPETFTQNLMTKISREEIEIQSTWLDHLKKQVTIPQFSFRFAGAAAITAIFVFLAFTFLFNPSSLPGQKEAIAHQVEVTFTISGIKANQIAVAGDFNGWNTSANQLEDPDGDGIWTGKMKLEPGRYEYMLVVDDGKWVTDPNAKVYADDGFGSKNAVLFINNNGG